MSSWAALWLLWACAPVEQPLAPPPTASAPVASPELPRCLPDAPMGALSATVEVRVLRAADADAQVASRQIEAMTRYWAEHGLVLVVEESPRQIARMPALGGDAAALLARAPKDGDPVATREAVLADVLRPLGEFLEAQAVPAREGLLLVVGRRLVEPGSWAAGAFAELKGLTLSPHLSLEGEEGALRRALALPGAFTPTILLATEDAEKGPPPHLTAAHEVGHALGLGHHTDPRNLMGTRHRPCIPALDATQLATARDALAASAGHQLQRAPRSTSRQIDP